LLETRQLLSGSGEPSTSGDALAVTPSLHAAPFRDPRGDILPSYTGVSLPGMDVVAHKVTIDGDRLVFYGTMAGRIEPTREIGGLYLFGVDRGRGTPRFLNPAAGPPFIGPNVTWDLIVRVNPDGTGLVNNALAGVITALDPADIRITGNHFTASIPLGLLTPNATLPPEQWTYNLWPRDGIGRNVQVSDLAPDDGNAAVRVLSRDGSYAVTAAPQEAATAIGSAEPASADHGFSSFEGLAADLAGIDRDGDADVLN
jgi:hypothetical protein